MDTPSNNKKQKRWLRRGKPIPPSEKASPSEQPILQALQLTHSHQNNMLELSLFAPLDTVGVENYIRYGAGGPRRYGIGLPENHVPTPDHILIMLEISKADQSILFKSTQPLRLQRTNHIPNQRTIWALSLANLQVIWVWDFFRLSSYVRLRVEVNSSEEGLLTTLKNLEIGDSLTVRVDNPTGQITQQHVLNELPKSLP